MHVPGLPDPIIVTTTEQLVELGAKLSQHPIVAVDTESNSLYAYQEQVCLIQFSTPEADYLVDALSIADLSALGPLFADPNVEKVFHAAEYDVICLRRDFGFRFAHIFDTMVAACLLGRRALGLTHLLEEEFGIQTNKRYQRANWGRRPLPPELLTYAQMDTHFLIPLRHRLKSELERQGRWSLAQEDFARLCQHDRVNRSRHEGFWRVRGAGDLSPRQAAVLKSLWEYRDEIAQELNRPLFKVFSNQALLILAQRCPQNERALRGVRGLSSRQIRRWGTGLIQAVQRGMAAELEFPPEYPKMDHEIFHRLEVLRNWRKQRAQAMGVRSDVVLPREEMILLAKENPKTLDELRGLLAHLPWRRDHFAKEILSVLLKVSKGAKASVKNGRSYCSPSQNFR
jgi:ribonuclease D